MNYNEKNVAVLGGAGFIGSSLTELLSKEGANVFVYDNLVSGKKRFIENIDKVSFTKKDIRDKDIGDFFETNEIDYVFHLAALPYIPSCYDKPLEFFDVNATGTFNVMMEAKKAGVKRCLMYSTSEVYGTAIFAPMDEYHPLNPASTYSASKLAADRLCFTLHHEQELPVIIMRQFNCYGPRETHPYVIPEIITQLNKSNNLKLGNIRATRDFTYVYDAAEAAMRLMEHKSAEGQVYNNGSGKDYTIEEIANILGELMGHNKINIEVEKQRLRPLDVNKLQANCFKLWNKIDWKPKISFKDGLQRTIDDFHENKDKWVWEETFGKEEEIWKKDK